ncbi:chlorhexidine efflux transporter [Thauera humireducens]|uniref:chlorhexidine efflux transporter n=1 Tax=Thauera humireducens TaxID=1134435 RepID=UPI00311E21C9
MTLPIIVWWTGMGWIEAAVADVLLAITYTVYALLFNLGYDRLFPIRQDTACAAGDTAVLERGHG